MVNKTERLLMVCSHYYFKQYSLAALQVKSFIAKIIFLIYYAWQGNFI